MENVNDYLSAEILKNNESVKSGFEINVGEEPIFECVLSESALLITTSRLLSKMNGDIYSVHLRNCVGISSNDFNISPPTNDAGREKVRYFGVKTLYGGIIPLCVDSHHPAYFAQVLLSNMISMRRFGKWFINPRMPPPPTQIGV